MAFTCGLLVLTKPVTLLYKQIPTILKEVSHHVYGTLYVHLAPGIIAEAGQSSMAGGQVVVPCSNAVKKFVNGFYAHAASQCGGLDVRILLSNISNKSHPQLKQHFLNKNYLVSLLDCGSDQDVNILLQYIRQNFPQNNKNISAVKILQEGTSPNESEIESGNVDEGSCNVYNHVVLGGTFDRLHTGHKVLLGEACFLCGEQLTIGVTEAVMNTKKTLHELIEPTEKRINILREFLEDTKPSLEYNIVGIVDPYGPSIVYEDMRCIVVSQETLRGGHAVNTKRKEKGLRELDIDVIELVEDVHHSADEEEKISSSSFRKRLLGTLIQSPQTSRDLPSKPYILGLTGGIASGKSSICKRLAKLGAAVVDCDKLGHQAYEPGTDAFQKLVDHFGHQIVGENGTINRGVLGRIVFADKNELTKLNSIVWPSIANLAQKQIQDYYSQGREIVILDAAVLLEAGWDSMTHEVWTTFIPKEEAVKRIMERNKFSKDESLKRINSQMTNEERISKSNVVLSTLWEYEVTQKQVEKAWSLLKQRINSAAHL